MLPLLCPMALAEIDIKSTYYTISEDCHLLSMKWEGFGHLPTIC